MSKSAIAQRIAVVAHDFAGGGTERIALRLAREWVRAGRSVVVLTALPDGPLAALLDPAIELVIIGPGGAAHGDESLWSRRQFARAAGAHAARARSITERTQLRDIGHTPTGPLARPGSSQLASQASK